jgi:hypothetical protein
MRRLLALPILLVLGTLALILAPKSVFYRDRHPTRAGRSINRLWTWVAAAGLTPDSWPGSPRGGTVALEVRGRRSGAPRRNVITWVEYERDRYFVSMLDDRADWVRNVRAAGGEAVIVHGHRQAVQLEEIPVGDRAPVIKAYMKRTRMATQEHLGGIAVDAPLSEFETISPHHPVFRIDPR